MGANNSLNFPTPSPESILSYPSTGLTTPRRFCGTPALRVFHLNDSRGALGSRLDRHAHIGEGTCGRACFQAILNHAAFADVPKILETPKGTTEKGTPWDVLNIRRLNRLARPHSSGR